MPDLELDKDESAQLSRSIVEVQRLYPQFDLPEKVLAWGGLIAAAGFVYGPRIVMIRLLLQARAKRETPHDVVN